MRTVRKQTWHSLVFLGGGMYVLRPRVHRKITNWAKGNITKYQKLKRTRWNKLKIKINEKIIRWLILDHFRQISGREPYTKITKLFSPLPNRVLHIINNHNKKNPGNKITKQQLESTLRFLVGWNIAIFINESFILTPFYCVFAYFFFETLKEKCQHWNYCYGESKFSGRLKSMIEEDVVNFPVVSDILEKVSEIIKNELARREFEEIQKFGNWKYLLNTCKKGNEFLSFFVRIIGSKIVYKGCSGIKFSSRSGNSVHPIRIPVTSFICNTFSEVDLWIIIDFFINSQDFCRLQTFVKNWTFFLAHFSQAFQL